MKWKKYTIKTTTAAEDYIGAILAELGVEGVEIEDQIPLSARDKEALFIDILPELPPDEGLANVSFFLEEAMDASALLEALGLELKRLSETLDVGEATIQEGETDDQDWINNWKQYFKAFSVDDIYIKPTWEEKPVELSCRCMVEIDPGTSFGTGKHETTQLCIHALSAQIKPGDRILDVGCGSGILSIIGLKLGAEHVTGIDVDPVCKEAVTDNMGVNGILPGQWTFYEGNLIEDRKLQQEAGTGCYDVVVANILADIIIPLTPVIPGRLKSGGLYITSGIIEFKEQAVTEAIKACGFSIVSVNRQGEWVGITARKK